MDSHLEKRHAQASQVKKKRKLNRMNEEIPDRLPHSGWIKIIVFDGEVPREPTN